MELNQIVSNFQKKDVRAFEQLYQMYHVSLSGVIFNIVRDRAMAEELMHDVFVKIWDSSHTYNRGKGRFFTWILNIARNAAIDKTRSRAFKEARRNVDVSLFSETISSHDDLDAQTNVIGIRKVVNLLADKCKKIIDAIYFKGFTQQETSQELDIPLGTVKTRNRKCIGELRTMLE